jgi:hypothetical protein
MPIRCADPGVRWAALLEPPTLTDEYLVPLLNCLIEINLLWFEQGGTCPALYRAGAEGRVRYKSEVPGDEHWRAIPHVLRLGFADCKSLAAWRVAELRASIREDAKAWYTSRETPTGKLWHIIVHREDGSYEDPSRILGMR